MKQVFINKLVRIFSAVIAFALIIYFFYYISQRLELDDRHNLTLIIESLFLISTEHSQKMESYVKA